MNETDQQKPADENVSSDKLRAKPGWKVQVGILGVMLVLALIGMGLTQASDRGAWEYWLLVVVVYAGLGLWRSTGRAKRQGQKVSAHISRELTHWAILMGFLGVVLMFERQEIVNRQSASVFALLMLALTCCLSGFYVDWLLVIVGVVLTIMAVAMALLEQYTLVLWGVMIVVAIAASVVFFFKSKEARAKVNPADVAS